MTLNVNENDWSLVESIYQFQAPEAAGAPLFEADGWQVETITHHPIVIPNPSDNEPAKLTPQQALFCACGYRDWADKQIRANFRKQVEPAVARLFDGERTWHEHSNDEKSQCISRFVSILGLRCNPQI